MAQFREDNIPNFSWGRIQKSRRGYEIYVRRKYDSKSKNILPILENKDGSPKSEDQLRAKQIDHIGVHESDEGQNHTG